MQYIAVCHTCRHQHKIDFDPRVGCGNAFSDWYTKHPQGHVTEFLFPQRRQQDGTHTPEHHWSGYLHNANVKVAYAASAAVTITLGNGSTGLGASSTWLSGRQSDAIDNGTNLYLDRLAAGNYRAHASNTQAGTIYTCVVGARDDTPTWPDAFTASDAARNVSKAGIFNGVCKILSTIAADNTASQTWYWGPASVAAVFGGWLPDQFVFYVSHNIQTSTNQWSVTAADHAIYTTPVYATVI